MFWLCAFHGIRQVSKSFYFLVYSERDILTGKSLYFLVYSERDILTGKSFYFLVYSERDMITGKKNLVKSD